MSDFYTVNKLARYFKANPKRISGQLLAKVISAYKVGRFQRRILFG